MADAHTDFSFYLSGLIDRFIRQWNMVAAILGLFGATIFIDGIILKEK